MKVGRYELLERIGVGGMGEVWKARDPDLGRRVAVKLLKNVEGDDLARFRREARTAASLSHPNIAAVYEAADGFIAMQLVEGENLDARPRDPREAAELVRQAAIAVHHAHVEGIVHRDLKPANIMVQDGRAYVMDFGLAKLLNVQSSLSHTGLVVGTPIFMAPEQARGETVGIATDVYSLGATLYALVAGCPPFVGDTPYEIIRRVIEDEPPPLRGDAQLASIVHKCLDKEASRRYATALDLAQDLERWLEGRPVRAKRPWRPNRRAWAVALLAILAIGGMTAGWAWKSRGMDRRLQLARERETDRRLGEARDEYRALLDQDPKNGPAREGLERVDAAIRECGAALEVVRASLHAAARYFYRPDFRRAELLRLLSVATHHLERAYRIQEPTAEMRYLRAESLEMAGDDAAAEAELRATLAIDPVRK